MSIQRSSRALAFFPLRDSLRDGGESCVCSTRAQTRFLLRFWFRGTNDERICIRGLGADRWDSSRHRSCSVSRRLFLSSAPLVVWAVAGVPSGASNQHQLLADRSVSPVVSRPAAGPVRLLLLLSSLSMPVRAKPLVCLLLLRSVVSTVAWVPSGTRSQYQLPGTERLALFSSGIVSFFASCGDACVVGFLLHRSLSVYHRSCSCSRAEACFSLSLKAMVFIYFFFQYNNRQVLWWRSVMMCFSVGQEILGIFMFHDCRLFRSCVVRILLFCFYTSVPNRVNRDQWGRSSPCTGYCSNESISCTSRRDWQDCHVIINTTTYYVSFLSQEQNANKRTWKIRYYDIHGKNIPIRFPIGIMNAKFFLVRMRTRVIDERNITITSVQNFSAKTETRKNIKITSRKIRP